VEKEVIKEVIVEVPVIEEVIVEKIVEVPVEVIVEKIVEKIVEVPVYQSESVDEEDYFDEEFENIEGEIIEEKPTTIRLNYTKTLS